MNLFEPNRSGVLVEGCAGMAALSWHLFGMVPPVSYKGGKRSYAADIAAALGLRAPERIVLVEASWHVACALRVCWSAELRALSAERYAEWAEDEAAQRERWTAMLGNWPADEVEAGIQWLWMRPRTVAMREPHVTTTVASNYCSRDRLVPPRPRRGLDFPRRPLLQATPDVSVQVVHGSIVDVAPIPGATIYLDPPYVGTCGYAADLTLGDLLAVVERWRAAGCVVGASEQAGVGEPDEVFEPRRRGPGSRNMAGTPERLSIWRPVREDVPR
jgi:hypothetical protein